MSDRSQGEGWWLASDGKWYPPESRHPAPPPPPPEASTTSGLAIASLVLSLVWIYGLGSIAAIVFGHVALSQIKKSGGTQRGRGMAIAGLVLGYIGLVTAIIFIAIAIGNVLEFVESCNDTGQNLYSCEL